ncbi:MAG: hypothetical protein ABIO39_01680 [Caulobacteraceae bacterium]
MVGAAQNNGYSTYQGGDGRRYLIHLPMVSQICASCAQMTSKNRYSFVDTTYAPNGWFTNNVPFKNLGYHRAQADQFRDQFTRDMLSSFWRGFQSGGGGGVAIGALLHARKMAAVNQEELAKKFAECSSTNEASLKGLDSQLYWAQFVRDNGLTAVAVLGTGGAAASAFTMQVAAGAIVTKTGMRLNDMRMQGTLGDQKQIASVTMDAITDAFFCALAPALAAKSTTMATKVVIGVFVKAPIEGSKAMMNGASLQQIGLAVGLEVVGFKIDIFKELLGNKLLPLFAQDLTGVLFDAALSAAKDQAMSALSAPPGISTGESLQAALKTLFTMFTNFGMDERRFMEKYVVVPVK